MPKIQTINELNKLGFNTPEILQIIGRGPDFQERLKIWNDFYADHNGKVSIRTERDGEYTTPHFPNISLKDAHEKVPALLRNGYSVYIFSPIDPSECLQRGTICFNGTALVIEWLDGPGTVRDLEKSSEVKNMQFKPIKHSDFPGPVFVFPKEYPWERVAEAYCSELNRFRNQILEWSIYRNPVGKMKQREIYWELRRWQ